MSKPIVIIKNRSMGLTAGKQRVASVLFRFPDKEFSLSDLAKVAGVAKTNIGPILNDFHKKRLIKIVKLSNIWRIRAKLDNLKFRQMKIVNNLNILYNSNLVEFLNEKYNNPKAIILFGSFRNGEDVSGSDIDIAIERDGGEYEVGSLRELSRFEKEIGRNVQIHLFNRKDIDINVFNNIANGIILSGFLEVNP